MVVNLHTTPVHAMPRVLRGLWPPPTADSFVFPIPPRTPARKFFLPFPLLAAFLTGAYHARPGRNFLRAWPSYEPKRDIAAYIAAYDALRAAADCPPRLLAFPRPIFPFCRPFHGNLASYDARLRHDHAFLRARLCKLHF